MGIPVTYNHAIADIRNRMVTYYSLHYLLIGTFYIKKRQKEKLMQKLYPVAVALMVASAAIGAPTSYTGTLGDGETSFTEYFADTKGSAPSKTPWVHPTNVVNLASKESARLLGLEQRPLDSETLTAWFLGFPELGQSSSDTAVTIRNLMSLDWGSDELSGAGLRMYTDIMGLLYARWFSETMRDGVYGTPIKLTQTQIDKGISVNPGSSGYDEDSPIQLGKHAVSAVSTQAVSKITAANTKIRNVGIAIGAYATSEGLTDIKNQNIAIGPFAHAVGSSMIAIGPGIRETTETDWTGNNAFASGPGRGGSAGISIGYHTKGWGTQFLSIGSGNSGTGGRATIASNDFTVAVGPAAQALAPKAVALGRNSTANAEGAVQIGEGENTTPNSLQFMGVKIVENGRLVGGNADPKEWNIQQSEITSGNMEVQLRSGSVTTVLPEGSLNNGTELYVKAPVPGDLRNYEVYLPNEPEVRAGLPCGILLDELPAEIKRVIIDGKWQAHKLPAKITITQPYSRLVMGKIEEFDDGTDWSPIITDAHIKWDGTKFTADGSKLLEGTNLNSGVSLKIRYPISGGTLVTREVAGSSNLNEQGILDGTYYYYTVSFEYTPISTEKPVATSGSVIPITLIYETKCGTSAAEITVNYDTLP